MENQEKNQMNCCSGQNHHWKHWHGKQSGNAIYCFGVIGALIFFLGKTTTFLAVLIGIAKSIAWPAVLVYEALKLLIK
jgi:hypothetical protein